MAVVVMVVVKQVGDAAAVAEHHPEREERDAQSMPSHGLSSLSAAEVRCA